MNNKKTLAQRFRGFLPVVIDVETAGFNPETDALLEMAAVFIRFDEDHHLVSDVCHAYHIDPFPGANLEPAALAFTKIDPYHPFRFAVSEEEALTQFFQITREKLAEHNCHRAVLVGHNAAFDLSFLLAAANRAKIKRHPFHSFTTFDTATMGAMAFGQTVLARALRASGLTYDPNEAHSAIYDAKQTAELFCRIINRFHPR